MMPQKLPDIRFFDISNLPINISPPDQLVIQEYLSLLLPRVTFLGTLPEVRLHIFSSIKKWSKL